MMIMMTQAPDDDEEDDNSDQMIMSACEAFSADHSVDKSARDRVDAKGLYGRLRFIQNPGKSAMGTRLRGRVSRDIIESMSYH